MEDLCNSEIPNNYGSKHRPSSVMLEKAQLEKLNEISAYYDKYESILGQVQWLCPVCFHWSADCSSSRSTLRCANIIKLADSVNSARKNSMKDRHSIIWNKPLSWASKKRSLLWRKSISICHVICSLIINWWYGSECPVFCAHLDDRSLP